MTLCVIGSALSVQHHSENTMNPTPAKDDFLSRIINLLTSDPDPSLKMDTSKPGDNSGMEGLVRWANDPSRQRDMTDEEGDAEDLNSTPIQETGPGTGPILNGMIDASGPDAEGMNDNDIHNLLERALRKPKDDALVGPFPPKEETNRLRLLEPIQEDDFEKYSGTSELPVHEGLYAMEARQAHAHAHDLEASIAELEQSREKEAERLRQVEEELQKEREKSKEEIDAEKEKAETELKSLELQDQKHIEEIQREAALHIKSIRREDERRMNKAQNESNAMVESVKKTSEELLENWKKETREKLDTLSMEEKRDTARVAEINARERDQWKRLKQAETEGKALKSELEKEQHLEGEMLSQVDKEKQAEDILATKDATLERKLQLLEAQLQNERIKSKVTLEKLQATAADDAKTHNLLDESTKELEKAKQQIVDSRNALVEGVRNAMNQAKEQAASETAAYEAQIKASTNDEMNRLKAQLDHEKAQVHKLEEESKQAAIHAKRERQLADTQLTQTEAHAKLVQAEISSELDAARAEERRIVDKARREAAEIELNARSLGEKESTSQLSKARQALEADRKQLDLEKQATKKLASEFRAQYQKELSAKEEQMKSEVLKERERTEKLIKHEAERELAQRKSLQEHELEDANAAKLASEMRAYHAKSALDKMTKERDALAAQVKSLQSSHKHQIDEIAFQQLVGQSVSS